MAKPKKPAPRQFTLEELAAFQGSDIKLPDRKPVKSEAERTVFDDIGCRKIRIWGRTIEITGWNKKEESVFVKVNGEPSSYSWPFHRTVAFPFINFEVLDDCDYLERFANGTEFVIDGKRYGVKDDVLWADDDGYLSAQKRVDKGSFTKFLAGKEFSEKKCII